MNFTPLKTTYFLIIFLLSFSLFSQNSTLILNEFSYKNEFKIIQNPGEKENFANEILFDIARSIPKRPEYTTFITHYIFVQKFEKIDSTNYVFNPELKNFSANGDIYYKGINVSQKLIPGEIDYTLKIYRKDIGQYKTLVQQTEIKSQKLINKLGYFPLPKIIFSDTISNAQYNVLVEAPVLYFDEYTKSIFQIHLLLINEYYKTDFLINDLVAKVQKIDPENIDLVAFFDIELKEVEKDIYNIEAKQFPSKLRLFENDPINFLRKMDELVRYTSHKRAELNQRVKMLDYLYCEKGNALLSKGNLKDASIYFNKAIQINRFFAPAQYKLALMEFNAGNSDTAAIMVQKALTQMSPDNATQQALIELGKIIYNNLNEIAEKFNIDEKFNEAIATFENAKKLCNNTPGFECTDRLHKGLAKAKYGIYRSYIKVAEKSMANNRLDIAKIYIDHSLEYQKENSSEIISNAESFIILRVLCGEYVKRGNELNKKYKYQNALLEFYKCDSLCKKHIEIGNVSGCQSGIKAALNSIYSDIVESARKFLKDEQLENAESSCIQAIDFQKKHNINILNYSDAELVMSEITEKKYNKAINRGKGYLHINKTDDAEKCFVEAAKYETQYKFKTNDSLSVFLNIAGKPKMKKIIKNGEMFADINNINSAISLLNSTDSLSKLYRLENDHEIIFLRKNLKDLIFKKECYNSKQKYDKQIDEARNQIKNRLYQQASETLLSAIEITTKNILCNIDNHFAYKERERIKPAIEFLKMQNQVDESLAKVMYSECLRLFVETENYCLNNRIDTFGLLCPNIDEFVARNNDINFIYFCTEDFLSQKKYDKSLTFLQNLNNRSYPSKHTKNIQLQLGAKLAIRDKIAGVENYKIQILKYTEGEKWYNILKNSYLKTWRKN